MTEAENGCDGKFLNLMDRYNKKVHTGYDIKPFWRAQLRKTCSVKTVLVLSKLANAFYTQWDN